MCWDLPTPGEDTQSLVTEGHMVPIAYADLAPGDAVGKCGPGSLGAAGHIQLVESYDPSSGRVVIWEQAGGTWGPRRRELNSVAYGYGAYRFTGTVNEEEEQDMTPEQWDTLRLAEAKAHNASALEFAFAAGLDNTDQCVVAYGGSLGQPLGLVDLRPFYTRVAVEVIKQVSGALSDTRGIHIPGRIPMWTDLPRRRRHPRDDEDFANVAFPETNDEQ